MARYTYAVMGIAKPSREDEYRRWYREQHIKDVCAEPGVVSARLLAVNSVAGVGIDVPAYCTMVLYELEVDDVQTVLASIRGKAASGEIKMSEAAERTGSIHLVLQEIAQEPG